MQLPPNSGSQAPWEPALPASTAGEGQRSGGWGEELTPSPAVFSLKSQEAGCFHRRPLQTQQLLGPSSLLLFSHLVSLLAAHIRLYLS